MITKAVLLQFVILLSLSPIITYASIRDVLNATCRVMVKKSEGDLWGGGSGIVYKQDDQFIYILTAGHVLKDKFICILHFFVNGEQYPSIIAFKHQCIYDPPSSGVSNISDLMLSGNKDFAIVKAPIAQFGNKKIPIPIPLANKDLDLLSGGRIMSSGSSRGEWPTAFLGRIDDSKSLGFFFKPKPNKGRSGSVICDASGTYVIGIVLWKLPKVGYGINHKQIHKFISNYENKQKD